MRTLALILALSCLSACDQPAPARIMAGPVTASTTSGGAVEPRSAPCKAGAKCENAVECGVDMLCVEGECVAPCEMDEHCAPGSFEATSCYKEFCRTASLAASCPAACEAGSSCAAADDCPATAPVCAFPIAGEKGVCVAPCAAAVDCKGSDALCVAEICRGPGSSYRCN